MLIAAALYFCSSMFAAIPVQQTASESFFNVKQELIGEKGPDTKADDKEDTISPNGERLAWRDKRGSRWVVMLDGKPYGPEYDEIKFVFFSPDSRRLAYFGRRGKDWTAVIDGQPENTPYREVGALSFSKDGEHRAYVAKKGNQWLIVTDGMEGPAYEDVGRPRFSPKSGRLVYAAKRRDAWVIMDSGKEATPEAKDYTIAGFTPQEEKLISVASEGKQIRMLIGENQGPLFDFINLPVRFGGTDDHFAYAAGGNKRYALKEERSFGQVVVDNKEGTEYEAAPIQSTKSMWLNALGGKWVFLERGVLYGIDVRWRAVSSPTIGPAGDHIAYAARRGDKDYAVVVDGEEGPSYEAIPCGPSYSPDGRLFYAGFAAGKLVVIADGKALNQYAWQTEDWKDSDQCSGFLTSKSGHFAFHTLRDWSRFENEQFRRVKHSVYVDGEPGKEYEAMAVEIPSSLPATADFHAVYVVHDEKSHKGASFVVLDGEEGRSFDQILPGSARFSDNATFAYVARSGRKFFRVTHEPRPGPELE